MPKVFTRLPTLQIRRSLIVMRVLALVLFAITANAQRSNQAGYMYDINGRRVPVPSSSSGNGNSSEQIQDINGRVAALEKSEEKILSDTATEKVIERTIRRFDRNGNPGPIEKVRVEENKSADGSTSTVLTTVLRGDLNGNLALFEKSTKQTMTSGGTQTFSAEVIRPTLNGPVEVVEKSSGKIHKSGSTTTEDTIVYRKDANGRFAEAAHEVSQKSIEPGKTTENRTKYSTTNGKMEIERQTVTATQKLPDGSEVKDVSIYGNASPGRPSEPGPQLREQQRIVRQQSDGETTETLSIRRPSLGDRKELGEFVKVGEKVCTGKCE